MENRATLHPPVRVLSQLDLRADEWQWPFASERRTEIDAHFAQLRKNKPQLWNGRVLLARDPRYSESTFSATYFETDFASFLAWRDWGYPDRTVFNGFAMGALRGSDGGFVLGEMATHTANAGRVYFPSGTPDPSDRREGRVDLGGSVAREVQEETGLTPEDYIADPRWTCIATGQSIALIQILQADIRTEALCERIAGHIRSETHPELVGTHIVRNLDDVSLKMPNFIAAFIASQSAVVSHRLA